MERHLDAELNDLKEKLLLMGGSVEAQLQDALHALTKRNSDLAHRVVEGDRSINKLDIEIDETCLRLLALHQPTAGDLRFITTTMKISTELERMSDLAENIAERAIELNQEPQLKPYIDIPRMAEWTIQMVKECLDAFVHRDAELARKVCRDDDFVDDLTEQLFRELVSFMLEDPRTITRAARLTFIGKYYERIADHATNVGELVVYYGGRQDHPAHDGRVRSAERVAGSPFSQSKENCMRVLRSVVLSQLVSISCGAVALLGACATAPDQGKWIKIGQTAREEVVERYGRPDLVMASEEGETVIYRSKDLRRSSPKMEVPTAQAGPLGTVTTKMEPINPGLGANPMNSRLQERPERELRIRYDAQGIVKELTW